MRFKHKKDEVVYRARDSFRHALESDLYRVLGLDQYNSPNSYVNNAAEAQKYIDHKRTEATIRALTSAMERALESLIHDIYTDEEFEEDLNLRDKQ